jgi:hypothetical protein
MTLQTYIFEVTFRPLLPTGVEVKVQDYSDFSGDLVSVFGTDNSRAVKIAHSSFEIVL